MYISSILCLLLVSLSITLTTSQGPISAIPVPVILWHGMGDTCCNPLSLGPIKKLIEENIEAINVTSLQIGSNFVEDFESGYFRNANDQVAWALRQKNIGYEIMAKGIDYVCKLLNSDPMWKDGYSAVGFSQGGLLLRGLAERCPSPVMINLISIGGPQQGVFGLPHCPGEKRMCDEIRLLLDHVAYEPFIQNFLVQAEYWHDSVNEEVYRNQSVFLADINNDRNNKTESYKDNLKNLLNLVLVMFTKDTMVEPKESEWFGFYHPGQKKTIFNITESPLYQEDWIGLKSLNDSGKLHLLSVEGDHLQFTKQWFIDSIIKPYLT